MRGVSGIIASKAKQSRLEYVNDRIATPWARNDNNPCLIFWLLLFLCMGSGSHLFARFHQAKDLATFGDRGKEHVRLEVNGRRLGLKYKNARSISSEVESTVTGKRGAPKFNASGRAQVNEGEKIIYREIEEGIDLTYQAKGNKIKEEIIIKRAKSIESRAKKGKVAFSFELDTSGLRPEMRSDGTIHFYDVVAGKEIFYFEKPFMVDNAKVRSDEVYLSLGADEVILSAQSSWLMAHDRRYPIIIDPTIVVISTFSSLQVSFGRTLRKDSSGRIHYSVLGLIYSWSDDNGETLNTVTISTITGGGVGTWSLDVDDNGLVHVVYEGVTQIFYLNGTGSNWSIPQVIATGTTWSGIAIENYGTTQNLVFVQDDLTRKGILMKRENGNWSSPTTFANLFTCNNIIKVDRPV